MTLDEDLRPDDRETVELDALPPDPLPPVGSTGDGSGPWLLGWAAVLVAFGALVLGFIALGSGGGDDAATDARPEQTVVEISLGSMKLEPNHLMVPPGEVVLRVTNTDSQVHSLAVLGQTTRDLQPGESQDLELSSLEPGEYPMQCDISGHAAAGMTGTLMVEEGATAGAAMDGNGGQAAGAADYLHGYADWQEMQAAMDGRALRFVEEEKGTFGGRPMEYTTLPDGTKRFEVTAAIVDWEVEPGKVVKAWTYNGVVPAPEIHLEVGDKIQVAFHNDLPTATAIHFHGIVVPNSMDGVPPFTQPAVAPGEDFLYEFTATEPAVGIYHSHNGAEQVLDGLFGAFTIGQPATPPELIELGLAETPDQTINMVLNDAGVIGLTLNGKSFPATEPYAAAVGDTLMVNYFNEGLTAHPMHLHQPIGWIIAKDGKPLLQPIPGDTINVAPGERYTVLYKLTEPGVWAWHCHILTHAEGADGMFGMVTALIVDEA
jgi:FtsP/CotA-like multicopper oxidase with cupredoxin domain